MTKAGQLHTSDNHRKANSKESAPESLLAGYKEKGDKNYIIMLDFAIKIAIVKFP